MGASSATAAPSFVDPGSTEAPGALPDGRERPLAASSAGAVREASAAGEAASVATLEFAPSSRRSTPQAPPANAIASNATAAIFPDVPTTSPPSKAPVPVPTAVPSFADCTAARTIVDADTDDTGSAIDATRIGAPRPSVRRRRPIAR